MRLIPIRIFIMIIMMIIVIIMTTMIIAERTSDPRALRMTWRDQAQ